MNYTTEGHNTVYILYAKIPYSTSLRYASMSYLFKGLRITRRPGFARAVKKGQMSGEDFDLVRKVPALQERLQKWATETVKKPRRWIQETFFAPFAPFLTCIGA